MSAHLSALQLDELALGAMPAAEADAARAHLAECARCKADADAAAESRAHFTAAVLPKTMGAVRRRSSVRQRAWYAGFAAVLAAAAALFLIPRSSDTDLIAKGGPSLVAYYKRGEQVAPAAGAVLQAGDAVRLAVNSKQRFLAVLSIDSRRHITQWFAGELQTGERVELPGSIVLDDTPGPEVLYAVFDDKPVDPTRLAEELTAKGSIDRRGVLTLRLEKR